MSKVVYEDPVKHLKGKVCKHSTTIYKEMYGTDFTTRICNPRNMTNNPFSADELARQELFKQARAAADAILADDAQRKTATERFNKQKSNPKGYKTLRGMLIAEEYANLKA